MIVAEVDHRVATPVGAGGADASIVVLADRYATRRVPTLGRRRFDGVRTADGAPLELLP